MRRILFLSGVLALLTAGAYADSGPKALKDLDQDSQNWWLDTNICHKGSDDARNFDFCAQEWDKQEEQVRTDTSWTKDKAAARKSQVLGAAQGLANAKDYKSLGAASDSVQSAGSPNEIDDRVFEIWLTAPQLKKVRDAQKSYEEFQAFSPEKKQMLLENGPKFGVLPPARAMSAMQSASVAAATAGQNWKMKATGAVTNGNAAFDNNTNTAALPDQTAPAGAPGAEAAATSGSAPAAIGGVQNHLQTGSVPELAAGQAPTQAQQPAAPSGVAGYARTAVGLAGAALVSIGGILYWKKDDGTMDIASNDGAAAGSAPPTIGNGLLAGAQKGLGKDAAEMDAADHVGDGQ